MTRIFESLRSLSASLSSGPEELHDNNDDDDNETIAKAKQKLSNYIPQSSSDATVKVLDSFIEHLPSHGKRLIAKFVATCEEEQNSLCELAAHLTSAILIPMKTKAGKTPSVSLSATPDPDIEAEGIEDDIEDDKEDELESISRKDLRKLRRTCLERDNYRCVLSKLWDPAAKEKYSAEVLGDDIANTKLAHIIPFSLSKYKYKDHFQETNIARSWETLYLLFPNLQKSSVKLGPDNINDPRNVMTLMTMFRFEFGILKLALESTDQENVYEMKAYPRFQSFLFRYLPPPDENNKRFIKFEKHSSSSDDCELPSPDLLDTHAVIAKVLHASGQEKRIDEIVEDWEDRLFLERDGSTDVEGLFSLVCVS